MIHAYIHINIFVYRYMDNDLPCVGVDSVPLIVVCAPLIIGGVLSTIIIVSNKWFTILH